LPSPPPPPPPPPQQQQQQQRGIKLNSEHFTTYFITVEMTGIAHIPVCGLLLFVLLLPLAHSVDYLSAPWTPFLENGDVAFERIPAIAE
jgi:hypothetical protein